MKTFRESFETMKTDGRVPDACAIRRETTNILGRLDELGPGINADSIRANLTFGCLRNLDHAGNHAEAHDNLLLARLQLALLEQLSSETVLDLAALIGPVRVSVSLMLKENVVPARPLELSKKVSVGG